MPKPRSASRSPLRDSAPDRYFDAFSTLSSDEELAAVYEREAIAHDDIAADERFTAVRRASERAAAAYCRDRAQQLRGVGRG